MERLTCEVIARVHIPGSKPLADWYGELFDAALLVMQEYADIRLSGSEPRHADQRASIIVLDAWQRGPNQPPVGEFTGVSGALDRCGINAISHVGTVHKSIRADARRS